MFGLFPSRCDICDNIIRRTKYRWQIRGKNAWVCPACNSKLERQKSKQAFDPSAELNLPEVRKRSMGCGGWFLLLLGVCAVASIINPSSRTPMATTTPPPTQIVTPSPRPTISVADAQQEAIRRHPDLGVAGSKFNADFVARYKLYQQQRPDYFRDPSWPIHLAEEIASPPPPK